MLSSPNSTHLERWLGVDGVERMQENMAGWYGKPITIADVPGDVSVTPDGDFVGRIDGGQFFTGLDAAREALIKKRKSQQLLRAIRSKQAGMAGFTSLSDLMDEATVSGKMQPLNGGIIKAGATGVVGFSSSLWGLGSAPAAGAASAAAPGGTIPTSATTGAMKFVNPSGGDFQYIVSADMSTSIAAGSVLLYDRLFGVAVNPNTTVLQSVTGIPTRYQNATGGNPDSAVGNFIFFEVGATALAGTAHNITFTYQDQNNNASETAPVVTGISAAIVRRLDHTHWFCPLNAADSGIKNLTGVTMSAAVATGLMDAVIGHPLVWMAFPIINIMTPFDWVYQRFAPARVFDGAAVAMLEVNRGSATAASYTGNVMMAWG